MAAARQLTVTPSAVAHRRFQFRWSLAVPHLAMLFKELVEHHRVHRVVAHGVRFSFFIAHHQIGIHLFNILGDEAKLRDALGVKLLLVAEGNRFEREDRFARFVHRLDVLLKRADELTVPS